MPELPEVETIRRSLAQWAVGSRIDSVRVYERRFRQPVSETALRRLVGSRIVAVGRRAKYLLVHLGCQRTIVLHFGMSGRLVLTLPGAERHPHDHVIWGLQPSAAGQRTELRVRDPRRFGLVLVRATDRLEHDSLFRKLGPEPLGPAFAGRLLHAAARGVRRPVKVWLMDPTVVAGMGNIYASESLWVARVHPATAAGRIGPERWDRIAQACVRVLERAIQAGGTTLRDYRTATGEAGYFAVELNAYGRAGKPCPRCATLIRRVILGARSTFYCPRCQR